MANSNSNNDADIAHITGNAPAHVKRALSDHRPILGNRFKEHIPGPIFFEVIQDRFRMTELSIINSEGSDGNLEARVVVELDVEEDMLNGKGEMHTGCSASLIDMGSTLPLHALAIAKGIEQYVSVSQTMNVMYHSPARLGDKLKLINTTIILEGDAHCAKTEIWNASRGGLVASGSQIKMVPSRLPPQKL